MFPQGWHTEAVVQRHQGCLYFVLEADLVVNAGFEGRKGSWRTAEAWHCERPDEAIDEGTASTTVEALGLKGSWGKAEAWQKVVGLESLKRGQKAMKTTAFQKCQYMG